MHDDVVANYGYGVFQTDEVHKIGILDIRILNCDRNEENILVKKLFIFILEFTANKSKNNNLLCNFYQLTTAYLFQISLKLSAMKL